MDFHFLVMEKSWKINVEKEEALCVCCASIRSVSCPKITYLLSYYVCETNAQVDEEEAEAVGSSERRYQNRLSAAHQEKETRF